MSAMPFTAEQFLGVFAAYNDGVWPWQFLLAIAAAGVALITWSRPDLGKRLVPAFLTVLWVWSGIAYHVVHFARINPAAVAFGVLFVVQGILFACEAARGSLRFSGARSAAGMIGASAVTYALLIYPLLGSIWGHRYPAAPTFGAPCPSTIFTFGLLLWTQGPVPTRLLIIPALWAVVTAPTAIGWGVWQDGAMPLIALVTVFLLWQRKRRATDASGTRVGPVKTLAT
jgi:hypothetical protein